MRILLTGKDGQLGWELARTLITHGEIIAVGREELNLEDPDAIARIIRETKPALIVNAAAYTAVDRAETDEVRAYAVNATAPGIMAEEAARIGAAIVHYSTDYVFDGTKESPYTEEDTPKPLNVYGRSKLAGEKAIQASGVNHLILRTSWVYGAHGSNFVKTMLRLAQTKEQLRIVADQVGAPTWARMIAEASVHILSETNAVTRENNLYHLTCSGATSWHGFAQAIFKEAADFLAKENIKIPALVPVPAADYPVTARRPANSRLCCDKVTAAFELSLPDWTASLYLCMHDLKAEETYRS